MREAGGARGPEGLGTTPWEARHGRESSLFSQLDPDAFVAVMEGLELKTFEAGSTLVQEGEPGRSLFALVEGRVDVVRQMEEGRQRKVASLAEGEFFGEMALLSESPRLASVVAAERVVVLALARAQVERLVQRHPSVGQVLQAFHQERLLANVLRSNPLLFALNPLRREALFLLLRGRCRVAHQHPDGHAHGYPALSEGDLFGEVSVLLGLPATATVSSETPCTLLRLDREAVERHVLIQPGVREALSRLSQERLGRTLHEGDQRV